MTEVILVERVASLGQPGDVVTVRPGYARNKLIPSGQALRATAANKALFEARKAEIARRNDDKKQAAQELVVKLADIKVVILRQAGESGQLFGSVTARDVADAVQAQGLVVDKNDVYIEKPIKTLGLHSVRVEPHADVRYSLTVNVARNEHQAKVQAGEVDANARQYEDEDEDYIAEDEQN